jgi:hypothetical protein
MVTKSTEIDVPDELVLETIIGRRLFAMFWQHAGVALGLPKGRIKPSWESTSEEMRAAWRAVAQEAVCTIEALAADACEEE